MTEKYPHSERWPSQRPIDARALSIMPTGLIPVIILTLVAALFSAAWASPIAQQMQPDSAWSFLNSQAADLMDSLWRLQQAGRHAQQDRAREIQGRTLQLYQRALDQYLQELPRIQTSKEVWRHWWIDFDRQQERFWGEWRKEFGALFEQYVQALWQGAYHHRLEKTVPLVETPAIYLVHESGDVQVRGIVEPIAHLVAEIRVMATSRDEAEQYARGFIFQVASENSRIKVATRRPTTSLETIRGTSLDLHVEIPQECPLEVENSFGNVRIQDLKKGLRARTSHGSLEIHRCAGDLDLANMLGQIVVTDADGDLSVETSFGPIIAANIHGNVFAGNKFGSVNVSGISGAVEVENSAGPVQIDHIKGSVTVDNYLGDIAVQDVGGDLRIHNAESPMRIADVLGETHIENSSGEIRAEKLSGNTVIQSRRGDVILILDEVHQNIYRLDTSFGIVRVNLPPRPSALISAETLYGTIDSDFPLEIKRVGAIQRAQGKLGQGKASIELDAKNANIYLISSQR